MRVVVLSQEVIRLRAWLELVCSFGRTARSFGRTTRFHSQGFFQMTTLCSSRKVCPASMRHNPSGGCIE